jgi:hypothetical protein
MGHICEFLAGVAEYMLFSTPTNNFNKANTLMPNGKAVVLCVDDDDFVLALCQTVLELEGYTVLTATSGFAALDTFSSHVQTRPKFDKFCSLLEVQPAQCDLSSKGRNNHTCERRERGESVRPLVFGVDA